MKKIIYTLMLLTISAPLLAWSSQAMLNIQFNYATTATPTNPNVWISQGYNINYKYTPSSNPYSGLATYFNTSMGVPITDVATMIFNVAQATGTTVGLSITSQGNVNFYGLRAMTITLNGTNYTIALPTTVTTITTQTLGTLPGNGSYPMLISFPTTYEDTPNITTSAGTIENQLKITCTNQV